MKKYILLVSLGAATVATIYGIAGSHLAVIFGLFSISTLLIGAVYPTNTVVTDSLVSFDNKVVETTTKKIVNN